MRTITNTTLRITMYSGNLAIMHLHSVLLKLWSYISTLVFMDYMDSLYWNKRHWKSKWYVQTFPFQNVIAPDVTIFQNIISVGVL